MGTDIPEIHTFPSKDEAFRAAVLRAVGSDDRLTRGDLAARLRSDYPAVEVRQRDGLAGFSIGGPEVWYVFRDGNGMPEDAAV